MELSLSSEAISRSATQEGPKILWNRMVYYRVHQSPQLVPILSQIYPVHSTTSFSLGSISSNIFLLSTTTSLKYILPSSPVD
jgi:hypothetical protein